MNLQDVQMNHLFHLQLNWVTLTRAHTAMATAVSSSWVLSIPCQRKPLRLCTGRSSKWSSYSRGRKSSRIEWYCNLLVDCILYVSQWCFNFTTDALGFNDSHFCANFLYDFARYPHPWQTDELWLMMYPSWRDLTLLAAGVVLQRMPRPLYWRRCDGWTCMEQTSIPSRCVYTVWL